jgi:hypothetical protein
VVSSPNRNQKQRKTKNVLNSDVNTNLVFSAQNIKSNHKPYRISTQEQQKIKNVKIIR